MNSDSCECSKAELELFTVPPTNISMEKGTVTEHLPISSLNGGGPIEFHVTSAEEYIDVGRTFLYIKAKITKANGNNMAADDGVGPVNLFLHSLFSQVDITLNNKLITPSVNTYPYRAYIEKLLSYGTDAKNSQLSSELWYIDSVDMDAKNPLDDTETTANPGLVSRGDFMKESSSVEMMGRLHCDIFLQDRYLMKGTDMNIKLTRSAELFHLMSNKGTGFKTVIEDAVLFVRKVKLNPAIPNAHDKLLNQGKLAKYPVRRSVVSTFTISQGSMSINKDNVIMGQLPRRIIVGLVKNTAFNGVVTENPFNFQHFKLTYLALKVGSEQFPSKPLTPNYDSDLFLRSYMTLFEGTGMLNDNRGHGITRTSYKDGFALYAFDMTPDMTDGSHVDLIKHGNIKMELQFKEALASTVNVIVYAEYDNVIQVDRARNVITDF